MGENIIINNLDTDHQILSNSIDMIICLGTKLWILIIQIKATPRISIRFQLYLDLVHEEQTMRDEICKEQIWSLTSPQGIRVEDSSHVPYLYQLNFTTTVLYKVAAFFHV